MEDVLWKRGRSHCFCFFKQLQIIFSLYLTNSSISIKVHDNDSIEMPIDGTLDLHTFRPQDLGSLIPDYIEACLKKDIYHLRIIHGKGTGALRRSVHSLLDRNPHVDRYSLAGDQSSWGATLVDLKKI